MNIVSYFALTEVFSRAQQRGWIGHQDIADYLDHSLGFAHAARNQPETAIDLGSGGGIPALVLIALWPQSSWTLVEASLARAAFLELQCAQLGYGERVEVCHRDAFSLKNEKQFAEQADLVTVRSFGPVQSVIAAAAPLLRQGGELVVSAAPDASPWPESLLVSYGMSVDDIVLTRPRFHRVRKL